MTSFSVTANTPQVFEMTFTDDEVVTHVHHNNWPFFENNGQYLTQTQINMALRISLEQNQSFSFCQSIINLKPERIIKPCIFQSRYDLLLEIVEHYGVSVLEPEILGLVTTISQWSTEKDKLPLFSAIVQCLPNHTQKINRNPYQRESNFYMYSSYDNLTYQTVYQGILRQMLRSAFTVLGEAFCILAKKRFPIDEQNLQLIQAYHTEPFISMQPRLNHQNQPKPQGIGCHDILIECPLSPIEINMRKTELFKELIYHFQVPETMADKMLQCMQTQMGQMIPDDSEYRWISQFEHKPWAIRFFNRFYYYDKIRLHDKLHNDLSYDNEYQDDLTHAGRRMKI